MALTDAEEKALKEGLAASTAFIESVKPQLAEIPTLKTSLAAKDTEIAELRKVTTPLTVNSGVASLKTEYPDVPEATLHAVFAMPAESRAAVLLPMQTHAAALKAKVAVTDPTSGWADAGSIQPSTDAERIAVKGEREKAYNESKKNGNVFGMLDERAGEIAAHVRRALTR